MSFSPDADKLVEALIQAEYKSACEDWGEKYHSKKEACDVFGEEVREVGYEIDNLNYRNLEFIQHAYGGKSLPDDWLERTDECIRNAIKELAQVGAVLMKIKTPISEVKE